jgi:hypothetical protein
LPEFIRKAQQVFLLGLSHVQSPKSKAQSPKSKDVIARSIELDESDEAIHLSCKNGKS